VRTTDVTFFVLERHLETHSLCVTDADGFEKVMKMIHPNLVRDSLDSKQENSPSISVVMVGKVNIHEGGDFESADSIGLGSIGMEYAGLDVRLHQMVRNSLIPGVPLLIPKKVFSEWISLGVSTVHPSTKRKMKIRVVPQKSNESRKLPPLPPLPDRMTSHKHVLLQTNPKFKAREMMGMTAFPSEITTTGSGYRSTSSSSSPLRLSSLSESTSVTLPQALSFKERMRWHELRRMAGRVVFAVSNAALKRHNRTVVQCDIGHLEKSFQTDVSKYVVPLGHNGRRGIESELRYENVCRFLSKHGTSTRILVSSARLVHVNHQSLTMTGASKFLSPTSSKRPLQSRIESHGEGIACSEGKERGIHLGKAEEQQKVHLRFSDGAHRFAVFRDLDAFDAFPLVVPIDQAPLFKRLFPVTKNSKCPKVVDDDNTKFTSHQWHSSKDYKFLEMGDRKMRECYISTDSKVSRLPAPRLLPPRLLLEIQRELRSHTPFP
jgi:hypothetical protein